MPEKNRYIDSRNSLSKYINFEPEELSSTAIQADIISAPKYDFIGFCKAASKEQLEAIFSGTGLIMLLNMTDAKDRISGGVINGATDTDLLSDESLCRFFYENSCDIFLLTKTSAKDYFEFLQREHPEAIISTFKELTEDVQISLLQSVTFVPSQLSAFLKHCKPQAAQYLMDHEPTLNIDDEKYPAIMDIASQDISLSPALLSNTLSQKIATIYDVNAYRLLVNQLSISNDTEQIETARKKFYEDRLSRVYRGGLLPEFREFSRLIREGSEIECLREILGDFHDCEAMLDFLRESDDLETAIRQLNDYQITNMIIDYFFEEIPTNVILDMRNMMHFQNVTTTLLPEEQNMYLVFANFDALSTKQKIQVFNRLKGKDIRSNFYDNYSKTKEKMVDVLNTSLLNEANMYEYIDLDETENSGVNVYKLTGQPFNVLVKSLRAPKTMPLDPDQLRYKGDGASFSIDSSELLSTFKDPQEYYNVVYSHIPPRQLVHLFPVDSFTHYKRNADRNS